MPYLFLVLGLVVFLIAIQHLGIVARVRGAMGRMSDAVVVMRAPDIPDNEKEQALQKATIRMGVSFLDILARSTVAFILPLACIYGGILSALYSTDEAMRAASNPFFLICVSVFAVLAWRFVR